MAYFSNGTEGMSFTAAECADCRFWEPGCPIEKIHFLWNYDQHKIERAGHPELKMVMTLLIDDSKPLGEMCSMRTPPDGDTETLEMPF